MYKIYWARLHYQTVRHILAHGNAAVLSNSNPIAALVWLVDPGFNPILGDENALGNRFLSFTGWGVHMVHWRSTEWMVILLQHSLHSNYYSECQQRFLSNDFLCTNYKYTVVSLLLLPQERHFLLEILGISLIRVLELNGIMLLLITGLKFSHYTHTRAKYRRWRLQECITVFTI